jgi:acyltransferase
VAFDAGGHRAHDDLRGLILTERAVVPSRLLYLDWLRGVAVLAMVHAHTLDAWSREPDRRTQIYYSLQWIGGVASPGFLLLAGVAMAMSAASKARQAGSLEVGARAARRRGFEIFVLALVFRLQAELLGWGPLRSMLKVDMLNIMGLSMVIASVVWQLQRTRSRRLGAFALLTVAMTLVTPLVRATTLLAPLPDPLEAYLRPAGTYSAFPLFPWAGFLFAGVLVGDLVDAFRESHRKPSRLQLSLLATGALTVTVGYLASFQPPLFPTATFWNDSPTIYFIRLGTVMLLVPLAWLVEGLSERGYLPLAPFRAVVTLGRSSLFVYWIHVEMVYGLIAEPIKGAMPLWLVQLAWALMCVLLYRIVLWKNRVLEGYELPPRAKIFAAVLR